jgi:hypothetical protein
MFLMRTVRHVCGAWQIAGITSGISSIGALIVAISITCLLRQPRTATSKNFMLLLLFSSVCDLVYAMAILLFGPYRTQYAWVCSLQGLMIDFALLAQMVFALSLAQHCCA